MTNFAQARVNMIEGQLRPNRVSDERILATLGTVPRERFVPSARRGLAYVDEDLDVGHGRTLMEPMVFARLLEAAAIKPSDIVLDIGCGTGYSTAVIAGLCDTVVALESEPALADMARARIEELGIENAAVLDGPLAEGYPKQAPYDVIFINGAVAVLNDGLTAQLSEGGRLVAVVRPDAGPGRASVLLRQSGAVSRRQYFDASIPVLPEFTAPPQFVF